MPSRAARSSPDELERYWRPLAPARPRDFQTRVGQVGLLDARGIVRKSCGAAMRAPRPPRVSGPMSKPSSRQTHSLM